MSGFYPDTSSGGGGGGPTVVNGFADYNDATTATTPIVLPANTWTTVTNDGAGAFTNLGYLPTGVTRMMDTLTGRFLFDELELGDFVIIRNDFQVIPSTNNSILTQRYVLGAGANQYVLESALARLDAGSSIPYRFSLRPDFIYMGDDNTRLNPITLQVRLDTPGTLINAGSAIGANKRG